VKETGAGEVFWDQSFEPARQKADAKIRMQFARRGIPCAAINDALLFAPATLRNKKGTPFKVFTPFWHHCLSLEEPATPVMLPRLIPAPSCWPWSEDLKISKSAAKASKASKMGRYWDPGSGAALQVLRRFLKESVAGYPLNRDRPSAEGTSRLSPYLHFGEISVRQIWHAIQRHRVSDRSPGGVRASEAFLRQLVWREFAHHMLFHFPQTVSEPLRKEFAAFKWRKDPRLLRSWQKGETGYPIVDAGMRELRATGWMHNRVRMIAASFLVKDLQIDWREGAAWFNNTLVDADLANNTFGWQWVAGCGADAAPYFRIFNPVLQGLRFDPQGNYVRRWIPELSKVPSRFIHDPGHVSQEVLAKAGVSLGKVYPSPVVDHEGARRRALFAYARLRK